MSCIPKHLPRHPAFEQALEQAGLLAFFRQMAPSHQREYLKWITEATKEETQLSRIEKALEMIQQELSKRSS